MIVWIYIIIINIITIGNYYLHEIVKSGDYELRVELEDQAGERAYAAYTNFMIGEPSTFYTLEVSGFFGNAGMERGETSLTDYQKKIDYTSR